MPEEYAQMALLSKKIQSRIRCLAFTQPSMADQQNKTEVCNLCATALRQIKELAGRLILLHLDAITDADQDLSRFTTLDIEILRSYSQLVPTRDGPMLYLSDEDMISQSLKKYGEWAANEINFLSQLVQRGSHVADVGAFIGTHSRAFSTLAGRSGKVHSFEPNEHALKALRVNAAISEHGNISIYPIALSSKCDDMEILTPDLTNLGYSFLQSKSNSPANAKLQSSTLDAEIGFVDRLDFVKLDVEGMELEVLEGAQTLIDKFSPTIYAEINSLAKADCILKWAESSRYEAYGCIHDAFNQNNFNNYQDDIFSGGKECGILLVSQKRTCHSIPSATGTMTRRIQSIDDIGLILAKKPQYSGQPL